MTPDGISTKDWDRVQDVVHKIVHASAIKDDVLCEHHSERLFGLLFELETQ